MQPENSGLGQLHKKWINFGWEEPPVAEAHLSFLNLQASSIHTHTHLHLVCLQGCKHRHLLATLRALEAASLSHQSPSLPGSDSEEEEEVRRKKRHLQRPSLASISKEVEKKKKGKCQKHVPSISASEGKEVGRKCHRQAPPLGGISAGEEKGKRRCQEYSSLHLTQALDSVDQTGTNICEYGGGGL